MIRSNACLVMLFALITAVVGLGAAHVIAQEPPPPPPPPGADAPPPGAAPPPPGAIPPPPPGAAVRPEAGPEDIVTVEAEGEGMSKDEARRAALRAALEKGGKTEIFSNSRVENFQLMHDTIISRAEGIVTDYKTLKEEEGVGGTFRIIIRARVSKKALHDSWGAIQNVLNQVGRPKIMVYIVEKIEGREEEVSILGTEIEKRLNTSGFDLVAEEAVRDIREREKSVAELRGNLEKLRAIAKDAHAEIFISGTANADRAGIEDLYGAPVPFYNCDVQVKAYYTDTGKLLAAEGIPVTRGGARGRKEFSPQAGKMALSLAGKHVVERLYRQVMSQWATQISTGGELVLELQGMNFKAANDLKKAIADMPNVSSVNFKLTEGIATYHINARMAAQDLAERLSAPPFDKILEIGDLKLNRIQGKAVGKP